MVVIRDFKEQDGKFLAEIYAEAFDDEIEKGMEILTAQNFSKFAKRREARVLVAEENELVVGYVATSLRDGLPARIHTIAVKKEFRSQGIGKSLVKEAMKYAESEGRKKICLNTRPWNKTMRKICLDLNFIPEAYLREELREEDLIRYSAFLGTNYNTISL